MRVQLVLAVVLFAWCLTSSTALTVTKSSLKVQTKDSDGSMSMWELPLAGSSPSRQQSAMTSMLEVMSHKKNHHHSKKNNHHKERFRSTSETQVADKAGVGAELGSCRTCVFFVERVKKGVNMLLPSICSELYAMHGDDAGAAKGDYSLCEQTLSSVTLNGNNIRYWLLEGCYKYEIYQSKEWIRPCPSHVICAVLKDLSATPFCKPLPMEDPFA